MQARTELVAERKVEETKSRLRYGFTSQLDNSSGIAEMLASIVHFWRTPETINEVYRTYDSLTASDLRDAANRYFVDSQRVTVTLANDERIAGIDGRASVDALVAAAGMAPAASESPAAGAQKDLLVAAVDDPVPVMFVANQSTTSPLVDVSFIVHTGAGFDPEGKKGLAAMTAAMVSDGGSEAMTIEEINDAMYPLAAGFSATPGSAQAVVSGLGSAMVVTAFLLPRQRGS